MNKANYNIRAMTRDELDLAVEWAAQEGWNPGLYDADCFYKADPNGFLIGLLDEEPIGCISAVSYGPAFGFMGFYIVKPAFRGQGFGIRLWNAALDYLRGANVGLDGVVEQQANYKKSGFQLRYRNIRFETRGTGRPEMTARVRPLSSVAFAQVAAYDDTLFPSARHAFLRCWIAQPESHAFGVFEREHLAGYAMLRRCRQGYKIGPLFADDTDLAKALLDTLIGHVPAGEPVYFDVPECNPAALALVESRQMQKVFETARMYTGEAPAIPLDRLFGVTSFELG